MVEHPQLEPPAQTLEPSVPSPDENNPASFPPSPEEESVSTQVDAGSTQALAHILRISPLLDLHQRAGDTAAHPVRGAICFGFDFILRLAAALLMLGIIAAVAWKTLAPLPHF